MPEAEDVITDAARHATEYAQALWRRHRPQAKGPARLRLADVAARLTLLAEAAFGRRLPLRIAQAPAPPTWLSKLFQRGHAPAGTFALPATDGASIWLPASFDRDEPHEQAALRYRVLMLQQAMRAVRGSAGYYPSGGPQALRALYLLLEAHAADAQLVALLPGMRGALAGLRSDALAARPALARLAPALRPVEQLARAILSAPIGDGAAAPGQALARARQLFDGLDEPARQWRGRALALDWWTGELYPSPAVGGEVDFAPEHDDGRPARSARLARRPGVRQAPPDEDEEGVMGPSMVQTAEPHQQAEDPLGLQRPSDRDASTAAEEFADALSELGQARLVATPERPREVLLSDDPPEAGARARGGERAGGERSFRYPEWDWQRNAYLDPGATVLLREAGPGPQEWVDRTLRERAAMLADIRHRFEMLRARRVRVHQQLDGESIDLQAWIDAQADFRAGLPLPQRLYQSERPARRDMAVMLLVDVSGSTDGWVAGNRRVIDVEREALLLVCIALDRLGERFCVQAFSGEGPHGVVVRNVKGFGEPFGATVGQRIAGLEPERYTRAGAAIRHASAELMTVPAAHRLLLLLSDGKPNDMDGYEGRYGVEDMRQAVTEARLQGISPFCLTIDRAAATYLPQVFGPHRYALLPRPELLPAVLLDWLRKLVVG